MTDVRIAPRRPLRIRPRAAQARRRDVRRRRSRASTPTWSRPVARQIAEVVRSGVQVAVVIGGGNFFRGAQLQQRGMDRTRADYMGMLGTVMNSLALQDFLEKDRHRHPGADRHHDGSGRRALHPAARRPAPGEGPRGDLRRGHGLPYFSTDTTARAARAGDRRRGGADGQGRRRRVHRRPARRTRTPNCSTTRSPTARCIERGLKVADATAFSLCMDNGMPILVFNLLTDGNIARAVRR